MIDYFSLILGHALLTLALFRVMMHDNAEEPASAEDIADCAVDPNSEATASPSVHPRAGHKRRPR